MRRSMWLGGRAPADSLTGRRGLLLGATALAGGLGLPGFGLPGAGGGIARAAPPVAAVAPGAGSPPGNTVLPLPVPCADQPGDICGLLLEGAGSPAGLVMVFGQAFRAGDLPQGRGLRVRLAESGRVLRAQADITTRHADGSARFAVVALELPAALPQGDRMGIVLSAGPAGESGAANPAALLANRRAVIEIQPGGGGAPWRLDLLANPPGAGGGPRNSAGGGGRPWQWGPLAVQWRVASLVPPAATGGATSLRVVADVALRSDGTLWVDAWFRNDIAQRQGGGAARYTARVLLDGAEALAFAPPGVHHQYTALGRSLAARPGGHPAPPQPFLRPDTRYLGDAAATQPFDLTNGVDRGMLVAMQRMRDSAEWNQPFAARGFTRSMPTSGGRADIGPVTDWQAAWLQTGEPITAAFCIGQAEAGGGIPWHFWDTEGGADRRGGWLSPRRWPGLWTDPRGGPPPLGLMQQVSGETGWNPDIAHQPNIAFVPYLLTGRRAFLDELAAQSMFNLVGLWPALRTPPGWAGKPGADLIIAHRGQVRGSAWALRQLDDAAWVIPDEDGDAPILREATATNLAWMRAQIPAWTAAQGEAHGWIPGEYGDGELMAPWQQDFMASSVGQAARRGNADARAVLAWMCNFLVGRFQAESKGFAFNDGAAYNMAATPRGRPQQNLRSWAEIGAGMRERGISNGSGWAEGNYVLLALQSLAQAIDVLDHAGARQVYARIIAAQPRPAAPQIIAQLASLNIVPRGTQRYPARLRACTTAAPARG